MDEYGIWPLSAASGAVTAAMSWMADDTMVGFAQRGVGVETSVYDDLEPRMTKAPDDLMVAYEQAAYFVAVALRRAVWLADEGRDTGSIPFLTSQLSILTGEASEAEGKVGLLCRTTGLWCPTRGTVGVLNDAIKVIDDAGLPEEERVQLVTPLKKSKRSVQIRQAVPWVVLVGVGGVAGWYWMNRKRT
jgi:hypothetical protein